MDSKQRLFQKQNVVFLLVWWLKVAIIPAMVGLLIYKYSKSWVFSITKLRYRSLWEQRTKTILFFFIIFFVQDFATKLHRKYFGKMINLENFLTQIKKNNLFHRILEHHLYTSGMIVWCWRGEWQPRHVNLLTIENNKINQEQFLFKLEKTSTCQHPIL